MEGPSRTQHDFANDFVQFGSPDEVFQYLEDGNQFLLAIDEASVMRPWDTASLIHYWLTEKCLSVSVGSYVPSTYSTTTKRRFAASWYGLMELVDSDDSAAATTEDAHSNVVFTKGGRFGPTAKIGTELVEFNLSVALSNTEGEILEESDVLLREHVQRQLRALAEQIWPTQ